MNSIHQAACRRSKGDALASNILSRDLGVGRLPLAIGAMALALVALAAPWLAGSHPLFALAVRAFFSALCHQNPARSFWIAGSPAAICVRCLGIYAGVALGAAASRWVRYSRSAAASLFWLPVLLNAVDMVSEALHLHGNQPAMRCFLGLLAGLGAGVLLTHRRAGGSATREAELSQIAGD